MELRVVAVFASLELRWARGRIPERLSEPMPPADSARVFRFGDFVLDVRARTLRKRGVRLKVHSQPFEVLLLFLDRPGDIVSREDLQRRLWPADTFVDFENGLNAAMMKLRQ